MADQPDFLCVGAQKAATSWLHASLARLPGIFLPVVKESHYFRETSTTPFTWANGLRRGQAKELMGIYRQRFEMIGVHHRIQAQLRHYSAERVDEAWYREIFSFANEGDLRGEVCPSYFGLPEHDIDRVNAINPDVRVVLLVRDPVDRCWSSIRMHKKQRGDTIDIDRLFTEPDGLRVFLDYTRYDQAIPAWTAGVGDRLRVILFDDVVERPGETLDRVLEHIGYDKLMGSVPGARNVGDPTPMPDAYRLRLYEELLPQYEFLGTLFPSRVSQWKDHHECVLRRVAS
ncbi:MAG: sulfotransferase [Phycisphaerales bacterium]|nr:sulfotransferase [Phycisphaerales bacterium]